MKIIMKALGLKKGIVAIEDNKLNAAEAMTEASKKSKMIEIKIVKTKYPQGDERQLMYAITGKELPAGKLPADIGCIVFNTETCTAICRAFTEGMPLIERIVTVDGDCIIKPKNLRVAIGTPVSILIEHCGLKKVPNKIIKGGAMMGIAAFDIHTPVIKGTSAVLVFSDKKINRYSSECIHCGRCVESCPMYLQPLYLSLFSQKEDMEACEKYDVMSCVECGCCQYICPASVPVVQSIKTAKGRILENRMKKQLIESAKESEITTTASTEYRGRAAAARHGHAHHGDNSGKAEETNIIKNNDDSSLHIEKEEDKD
jgi:electron transport complex protein RnfC